MKHENVVILRKIVYIKNYVSALGKKANKIHVPLVACLKHIYCLLGIYVTNVM